MVRRSSHGPGTKGLSAQAFTSRQALRKPLLKVREKLHNDSEIFVKPPSANSGNRLGIKLWLIPPPYYKLMSKDREVLLALTQALSGIAFWPSYRMACVGYLPMRDEPDLYEPSQVNWTVGKGNISNVALTYKWQEVLGNPRLLLHSSTWSSVEGSMSEAEYRQKVPSTVRKGLSLNEYQSIQGRYGTAVFAPLVATGFGLPIGTMTVHAPVGNPLSEDQGYALANALIRPAKRSGLTPVTRCANLAAASMLRN